MNCEPEQNMILEPLEWVEKHTIDDANRMHGDLDRQVKRSMIHPQYARRFIKSFILDEEVDK